MTVRIECIKPLKSPQILSHNAEFQGASRPAAYGKQPLYYGSSRQEPSASQSTAVCFPKLTFGSFSLVDLLVQEEIIPQHESLTAKFCPQKMIRRTLDSFDYMRDLYSAIHNRLPHLLSTTISEIHIVGFTGYAAGSHPVNRRQLWVNPCVAWTRLEMASSIHAAWQHELLLLNENISNIYVDVTSDEPLGFTAYSATDQRMMPFDAALRAANIAASQMWFHHHLAALGNTGHNLVIAEWQDRGRRGVTSLQEIVRFCDLMNDPILTELGHNAFHALSEFFVEPDYDAIDAGLTQSQFGLHLSSLVTA